MDFTPIWDFLLTLAPWVQYVLIGLGSLVVILTGIDAAIPDEKDHGFFIKKVLGIPILGAILQSLIRFSVFRSEKKKE